MTAGGRPRLVRRYLHQPLWWAAAAAAFSGLFLVADAVATRSRNDRLAVGLAAEGVVVGREAGRAVAVEYRNPLTDQSIRVPVAVWRGGPLPALGDRVSLAVARTDPEEVALAGDRRPLGSELWWYVPLPAIALVAAGARRAGQRRTEALAAAGGGSFAMLGSVEPPSRFARRCSLALYPLDGAPGGAPVATVALLSTAGAPVGSPAFPVEVKGLPRPWGRVVARWGDQVLWPAGRASAFTTGRRPAAVTGRRGPLLAPAARPVLRPLPSGRETGLVTELAALVGAAAVTTAALVVTLDRRAQVDQLRRDGIPVVAEVTARSGTAVELSYPQPGEGGPATARAVVAVPSRYQIGRRYPAHVGDGGLRLDRERYDVATPLVTLSGVAAVVAAVVVRRRWGWRQVRRVAARGPYHEAEADWAHGGGVAVVVPGTDWVTCRVPVATWSRDPIGPVAVVVAGRAEPGEWVAVHAGGRWLPVIARARAPQPAPADGGRPRPQT